MLLSYLRHEYRKRVSSLRSAGCPRTSGAGRAPALPSSPLRLPPTLGHEHLLDLLQRPGMSAGKAGVEHGARHRRHVVIGLFQNG